MRKTHKTREAGVALVLTLLAVSFMIAITVQLFSSVNLQVQASVNLRDSVVFDALNRSGLDLARAALTADQKENGFDSLQDLWNTLDSEAVSSLLGEGDRIEVVVADQSGRLQVNALVSTEQNPTRRKLQEEDQRGIWIRFLTSGRFAVEDSDRAEALIDAIRDWIDLDDDEREKGAESGYYQGLSPPYEARNGAVQYLEELLRIRGMTPDIFYGNEERAGIAQFLTVYGRDGKININTAPAEVLLSLAEGMDDGMVQDLIEFRRDPGNRELLANPLWYREVLTEGLDLPEGLLTVASHYFTVTTSVEHNRIVRTGKGVLLRNDDGTQNLLSWEVR
ncbi:MAG TPA: general secretion pathway protein GspK [Desulfobacteraceae bacterium]|nr:general secretion pathway protein GspK [Desulfobacteraceae bacterium]